jgi:hypothetical protein
MYLSSQDPPYMVGLFIPCTIYAPDILLHVIILTTNSRKEMVVIINRKCFKIVALLVTFMFLLTIPASFAQAKPPGPGDPGVRIAEFWIGKPYYDVNGVRHNMDVAPYLKNDTTMLPFRYVGYALGLDPDDVVWDEAKRQVRITRGEITVKLDIGKKPSRSILIISQRCCMFLVLQRGYQKTITTIRAPHLEPTRSSLSGHTDSLRYQYHRLYPPPDSPGGSSTTLQRICPLPGTPP